MRLPDGETVGIVDVPGHRDFIENMLAGVGGIDAALLVVAADESIMPQTREHLAILRLLEAPKLIVALSKVDLVDDPEWLELAQLEIEELLAEHQLPDTPIVPLSSMTGAGMESLVRALQIALKQAPRRVDYGQPRLPVDRVFSVSGFGVVVTGTLAGGSLRVGDRVELQPSGVQGRVRGLQCYKEAVELASPGSRVAVNIAGVDSDRVRRGETLCAPGQLQPTRLVDARLSQLPGIAKPLSHNAELKLYCGAAETIANLRLLDADELPPGVDAWVQLRLRDALPLARGDRFILRYPSPAATIGGGSIIDAHPRRRLKRFNPAVIRDIQLRHDGTPAERLAKSAESDAPLSRVELQKRLGMGDTELDAALQKALLDGTVKRIGSTRVWATAAWQALFDRANAELSAFHHANRLRLGMPRAELRSRLNVKLNLLDHLIDAESRFAVDGNMVRLATHQIRFSDDETARVERLLDQLDRQPYTPPAIDALNAIAGEAVIRALLDTAQLAQVSDKIIFSRDAYDAMVAGIRRHIAEHGAIDARTLRDTFGTTRKYAIPMLERLDSLGITRRVGDARVAGRNF